MTGLELIAPGGGDVLNVRTFERLDPDTASIDDVADAREALTGLYYDQRAAVQRIDGALVRRVDRAVADGELRSYTFTTPGGWKLEVESPAAGRKIDAEGLRRDLLNRAIRGELELSTRAIEQAFKEKVTYSVDRSAFNTLARQFPVLRQIEELHVIEQRRRVKGVTPPPTRRDAIEGTAEEAVTS